MNNILSSIHGQDLTLIESCLQRAKYLLSPPDRPLGAFLLAGPTGVGKTETVHQIADHLHNNHTSVLTINCSEYQHSHDVAKLTGAPPGYLGHRETTPVLTQAALNRNTSSRCPISILLFDEIEKAHPSLFTITLSILDKANLKNSDNNTVNFERSLIFFTTNLGNHDRDNNHTLIPTNSETYARKSTEQAIRKFFSPEWLNRLTATIHYKPLDAKSLDLIIDDRIKYLEAFLDHRTPATNISISLPYLARQELIRQTVSIRYGARELIRRLDNIILDHTVTWLQTLDKPDLKYRIGDQQQQPSLHLVVNPDLTVEHLKTKSMSRGPIIFSLFT